VADTSGDRVKLTAFFNIVRDASTRVIMVRSLIAVAFAIAIGPAAVPAQTPDAGENPIIGVWKLNPWRSTFDPPPTGPPPQSNIRLYVDRGDEGIVALTHTVSAQGIPGFNMSVSRYDGSETPSYSGVQLADLLAAGRDPILSIS
jgi:hypothetical protein